MPNFIRAIPGLKILVSLESILNCRTLPCGTPSTSLDSGAGIYSGPITKFSYASNGGLWPGFSNLNGGALVASNSRTGGAASDFAVNSKVNSRAIAGSFDMVDTRMKCNWIFVIVV